MSVKKGKFNGIFHKKKRKKLGSIIRQYRRDKDIAVYVLSEKIGISRQALSSIENKIIVSDLKMLLRLEKATDIPINTLINAALDDVEAG
jgi:transcriptional regulator with XRE-family HTH domain